MDINETMQTLWANTSGWVREDVLNTGTLIQLSIICLMIGVASVVSRFIHERLEQLFLQINAEFTLRRLMVRSLRLIFPAMALLFIALTTAILKSGAYEGSVALLSASVNLLLAWVVIRFLVQFLRNSVVRNIVATTIWVIAALSILGVLDNTTQALDAVGLNIGEFRLSILTVVKAVISLFALLYIASFAANIMDGRLRKVEGLSNASKLLIAKILRFSLVAMAILIGISAAGVDLSLLAVFSGAVGLGIGFGLQKVISNIFSGMLLLMDESIKPGDIIELPNGAFGWVEHMGARYTEIITRDNKSFLIPNEDFITQQVVNWSHGDTLIRVETTFGVSYKADPHLVKKLAVEAAVKPERVVSDPEPVCHLVEFGDSSLNFTLRFWIKDAEKGLTNMRGDVMLELWDSFKEHGINIPYPHREVYIHEAPETVTKKRTKK